MGSPILIGGAGHARLERIELARGEYNEAWLQDLIFDHPELLPIAQIEPGFGMPVPVVREMVCTQGAIDNLYVTPTGEIILVEVKLWRNPQARREVVAQALDYVSALKALSYEMFEASAKLPVGGLHRLVAQHPDALDEAAFIDAVAANLRRGRMLVMALGDGIRQETETLSHLLQSHAGAHFTFALVEIATYRHGETGEIVAIPSTLVQTVMIERGIVVIESAGADVKPLPVRTETKAKAQSISGEMFDEALARRSSVLPGTLSAFIASLEPLGVYPELKGSLVLKVQLPDTAKPLNLGYIAKNGQLWTDYVTSTAPADAAHRYLQALASLIGGVVSDKAMPGVTTNGTSAPFVDALLPVHAMAWRQAIADLIAACRADAQ
jgi:hypothetical protein